MQHKLIYSLIGAIALLVSAGPALAERHSIIQYGAAIYVVDVDRLGGSMLAGRYMGSG